MAAKINYISFVSGSSRDSRVPSRRTKRAYAWALPVITAIFVLTACTTGSSNTSSSTTKTDSMAPALELALGTLKLEGTEQAVDSEAAAQLLPLWQLLDELDNNGSAAPAEFTAVTEQIQSTMTSAQIKAIDDMDLTQEDIAAASQSSGSTTAASSTTTSGAQVVSAGADLISGGGAPGGGVSPEGGGPMPGGNARESAASSKTASSTIQPTLIEQVIRLLENRVQG
jgi:hypothetical protein